MSPTGSKDQMTKKCPVHALGALSEREADAFDAHIRVGCPECKAELQSFEAVAGRLAFAIDDQTPSNSARDRILSALGHTQTGDAAGAIESGIQHAESIEVSIKLNEGEWKEISPGLFQKHLFADQARGTVTSLFKLMPGTTVTDHLHGGVEECIVLEGDFRVNGDIFGPGDYRVMMPGTADCDMSTRGGSLLMIVSAGGYECPADR